MPRIPHTRPGRWPTNNRNGRFATTIRRDSPDDCRIAILGIPDDTGVRLNGGREGAAEGPGAFREALARYGTAHPPGERLPLVFDAGDVVVGSNLEETHDHVTAAALALHHAGLLPIAVGGGHDLTFPFVRALARRGMPLSGIYFDAHLDVREAAGSGMAFRRLIEDCGVTTLHLHGFNPLVNSREHTHWFAKHGGTIHGPASTVALPAASNDRLFASFDLDVLDASHAPGVSAPNPAGWSVREATAWVSACGRSPAVKCFDLMELNPAHDPAGATARVAAHLFLTFIEGFASR